MKRGDIINSQHRNGLSVIAEQKRPGLPWTQPETLLPKRDPSISICEADAAFDQMKSIDHWTAVWGG